MKRMYNCCGAAAVILMMASCEKDIDVDVPQQDARLVVNSVNVLGERIKLKLGHTVPILNYTGGVETNIPDALVLLYENEELADTMAYEPDELGYVSRIASKQGHAYRVRVTAQGYPSVEAAAEAPGVVQLRLGYQPNVGFDRFNNVLDGVTAIFTDVPGPTTDYYRLRIIRAGLNFQHYAGGCIESSDPHIENLLDERIGDSRCYSGEGIFCNDRNFDGQSKNIDLRIRHKELESVPDSNGNNSYIMVWLDHISEPYYKYLKTTAYLIRNDTNPFAEPSNAFTNISNGYGIFTVVARSQRNLR